jgi:predicted DsbA family dithiol-disulfide isomerase
MATATTLLVDVFADVVCPWCWIGERRLARALEARPHLSVTRRWRPYQLQPGMPKAGLPWNDFVRDRFGGWARARPMFAQVAAAGAAEGTRFEWERIAAHPNTVDAHRTILLAADGGRTWEVAERIFVAHFGEGRDVGDPEELARLAADAGLDADLVRAHLASDAGVDEVRRSQEEAGEYGATGVPFIVLDNRYAISGAQPFEVFLRALDTAAAGAA